MAVDLLLGLQWGDEGKGKIVDVLTREYDIIARFQGGPNAGHTLEFDGHKHVLHTIPSGIFHDNAVNLIGNGVVIDPVILKKELDNLAPFRIDFTKKLRISRKAHIILPTHRLLDAASEKAKGKDKIGSTLKGIGPTYMDKTGRNGLRIGDLEMPDFQYRLDKLVTRHLKMIDFYEVELDFDLNALMEEFLSAVDLMRSIPFIDSENFINEAMDQGKRILAEGAQGSLLDVDFGTYPFVTSSNTSAAGACTGLGVAPSRIGEVFGIFKAYTTRVGSGPFPTELFDEDGATMSKVGNEFGATTGRPRRCGWLDLVALKYAVQINGATQLMMMKGDVLSGFDTLKVCTAYRIGAVEYNHLPFSLEHEDLVPVYTELKGWKEDLTGMTDAASMPDELEDYIRFVEDFVKVPVKMVSVGPDRTQTIMR
jgi:adenylosuccinate synthase